LIRSTLGHNIEIYAEHKAVVLFLSQPVCIKINLRIKTREAKFLDEARRTLDQLEAANSEEHQLMMRRLELIIM
jgi:hypothetical protein